MMCHHTKQSKHIKYCFFVSSLITNLHKVDFDDATILMMNNSFVIMLLSCFALNATLQYATLVAPVKLAIAK